jgi:hypothetical protein
MEKIDLGFWLPVVLGILAIGKMIIDSYARMTKPNIKQDKELIGINKDISSIQFEMNLIKTNHLSHIEKQMKCIGERMVRIETILEERLPTKR